MWPGRPVAVKLFHNHYDYELITYTDANYDEIDEIEQAEDYAFGAKAYATIGIGQRNTLVASLAAVEEVYEAQEVFPGSDDASLRTYNAALEDEWWIRDNVSVGIGGIYTHFDQIEIGESSSAFNPQVVASWQLSNGLSLRASAAQRSRFPKLRELYRLRYGNPDLQEEVANSYEIGLRRQFDNGLGLDMAMFTIDLDGMTAGWEEVRPPARSPVPVPCARGSREWSTPPRPVPVPMSGPSPATAVSRDPSLVPL